MTSATPAARYLFNKDLLIKVLWQTSKNCLVRDNLVVTLMYFHCSIKLFSKVTQVGFSTWKMFSFLVFVSVTLDSGHFSVLFLASMILHPNFPLQFEHFLMWKLCLLPLSSMYLFPKVLFTEYWILRHLTTSIREIPIPVSQISVRARVKCFKNLETNGSNDSQTIKLQHYIVF